MDTGDPAFRREAASDIDREFYAVDLDLLIVILWDPYVVTTRVQPV